MFPAGDEFWRTQGGNNNAYCQDNETSWIDWSSVDGEALVSFAQRLIGLRKEHVVFRRSRFFHGEKIPGTDSKDVTWIRLDGKEMTTDDWVNGNSRALGVLLSGEAGARFLTERGEPEPDDTFLMLFNPSQETIQWRLPGDRVSSWQVVLDTFEASQTDTVRVSGRSIKQSRMSAMLLLSPRQGEES